MVLRVLVACEESQVVCKAFRELGHEAYSCDVQECSGGHPEWHIKEDVLKVIESFRFFTQDRREHFVNEWDLMIAHPPCPYLTISANRWYKENPLRYYQRLDGAKFFFDLALAPIAYIAVENPIGVMSGFYRKPEQIIQPWQYGHGETKATCLWLKNLPALRPTNIVEGREQKVWKMPASGDRAKLRSRTYEGIGEAMATQWSEYILNQKQTKVA